MKEKAERMKSGCVTSESKEAQQRTKTNNIKKRLSSNTFSTVPQDIAEVSN